MFGAVVVMLALHVVGKVSGDCTTAQLCVVKYFNSTASLQNIPAGNSASANLAPFCGVLPSLSQCIASASCTEPTLALTFQGTLDALNYVCTPANKQIIQQNAQCLSSPSLLTPLQTCTESYTSALASSTTNSTVCSSVKSFMSCVYNVLKTDCGINIARVEVTASIKVLQPLFTQQYSCTLGNSVAGEYSNAARRHTYVTINVMLLLMIATVFKRRQ